MNKNTYTRALEFHEFPRPGKISIKPIKPLETQRDLSLAYSPGVAAACEEIKKDPLTAFRYTSRGNLVAVISNGTAVLGLGNIGPLASKPVMEGKGVLFKRFSGIDVFDIEINELDKDKLVDIIASLEPTFGGINLEDIKAPECFYIEEKLKERMKIPVFHDDQHGTAIITAAAILNALKLLGKKMNEVKIAVSGAGASAISCLRLLEKLGLKRNNIVVCDSKGVIYKGREDENRMDKTKKKYIIETDKRELKDAVMGCDIFLGLSAPNVLTKEMIKTMTDRPIILALANPDPEILPSDVYSVVPDAIVCTGRSDFPNQVNNVLCFPFIFRGALDVGATIINDEIMLAAVKAIAGLAMIETDDEVTRVYENEDLKFGQKYIIPKPFDPRLIIHIAPAVAKAAMDSGVATRPLESLEEYTDKIISEYIYSSSFIMKPIFNIAKKKSSDVSIVFSEGESKKILHAVQQVVDESIAKPILIGRTEIIKRKIRSLNLRIRHGIDFQIVDNQKDISFDEYWNLYYDLTHRKGVTKAIAKQKVTREPTLVGALMVKNNDADGLVCGGTGYYLKHLSYVKDVIGSSQKSNLFAALNTILLPQGPLFILDTYVNEHPSAEELVEMTLLATNVIKNFGIPPKVALVSNSNFGNYDSSSAGMMRKVLQKLNEIEPELEVDGEMTSDLALQPDYRKEIFPLSHLKGRANLLIMPTMEAANIAFGLLRAASGKETVTVGPILLGAKAPVHILSITASVRSIVNMTALAVASVKKTDNL